MFRKIFLMIIFIFLGLFMINTTVVKAAFDPNYIISDEEVSDYTVMSLDDIQKFLINKGSYLASYSTVACTDVDVLFSNPCSGPAQTAAQIISERTTANKVSPRFLLVLIQKEQSLVEDSSPKQSQLDWAAGYGCPDGGSCNIRWQGFWKQINSAAMQFRDYLDNPQLYSFQVGGTYTFTNPYGTISNTPMTVTPVNQATAALYNYTPHVYNGNYNFYNIWQRYFTRNYPNGSLLQAYGEDGVWLIQNDNKRPFQSKGALISRFEINKIIKVNKADLDKYDVGAPIKFAQYSLVKSPRGTIFLLVDDKKRGFTSSEAFRKMGFNPTEVVDASWEDINSYSDGVPITATSTYPTGALLQNKVTGGVYWVIEGAKAPISDRIFLTTKFKTKKIIRVSPAELDNYQTIDPVKFADGELLKSDNSTAVYVLSEGRKRPIYSGDIFEKLGFQWSNIITVPPQILAQYDQGEPITEIVGETN